MEDACRDLPIDDYSVSQNTLDNVYTLLLSLVSTRLKIFYSP